MNVTTAQVSTFGGCDTFKENPSLNAGDIAAVENVTSNKAAGAIKEEENLYPYHSQPSFKE